MIHPKLGFDPAKLMAGLVSAGKFGLGKTLAPIDDARTRLRTYNREYKRRWRDRRRAIGLPI